jgi:hypothetical protein
MDKRLAKKHKRQVARARERVRVSEPDLRTPEQVAAAREASCAVPGRSLDPHAFYSTPSTRIPGAPGPDPPVSSDV